MEDDKKATEEKIGQLQLMEQNLQNFIMQKQKFQTQLFEVDNALKELGLSKDKAYKIVGTVMIASKREDLIKELKEKKSVLELRIRTIEKQEKSLKDKATEMQTEIMSSLKKK
ncbi:MAG: prefoldin subunit beta [Nanoarchaeota archaeon]|nr:prefoldin subunit beta [Nanoarchaeota archaeon]MCG2718244.1 prefoldin subunit beta [Nanoarchaeota archaeon]